MNQPEAKKYTFGGVTVTVAGTAGFCFGVDRAVKMTEALAEQGKKVVTLGPLIHNPQVVADLAVKGVTVAENPAEIPPDSVAVVRSHGVPRATMEALQNTGAEVCDATCPFVQKIHEIAHIAGQDGAVLLVAGDAGHPEVQGIVGHAAGPVRVVADAAELKAAVAEFGENEKIYMVAQTTYQVTKWLECTGFIKKVCTKVRLFDTICSATWTRQQETETLARHSDIVVVVGGRGSSNTGKLLGVAAEHSNAVQIETAGELTAAMFVGAKTAAVTAGASTPLSLIEEVVTRMSEVIHPDAMDAVEPTTEQPIAEAPAEQPEAVPAPEADASAKDEEMSFEEMLNESMKPVYAGMIVKGVVEAVSANEITVDIGTKQTGIVKLEELTNDPAVRSADEIAKRDEEIDLVVVKVSDQEGIIYLSKNQMEARKGAEEVAKAAEDGTILDGYVVESNKGGLVANVKGVKVFIPASQATARRGDDYKALVRQNVKLKIKEFRPGHTIGSIREVLAEEQRAAREAFWADVETAKQYLGTVKSLTSYGAFVDIGGVDGLVHISELSWNRIKHPSEVVNVGDSIEVYVKDVDRENQKVSLGYKKQEDNPWEKLKNEYPIGSTFVAPVVSITQFGAFVRLLPGVDGLVHISEISHDRVEKVGDVLSVGQEVEVKLLDVDFDRHRISLSMKALLPEPDPSAPERTGGGLVASSSSDETTVDPEIAAEIEAEAEAEEPAVEAAPAEETEAAPAAEEAPAEEPEA
ncbi:bifunctional 4-hydroxy-3-methylbut-2-enyl diphosphate reductase/30S ribosomal protein S1 [Ruminococcaceae bacterium OttesenSCG-928-D13]|nr:bifunctional 4-hydroxy-3-methylbut-2-enyl diphosphate reductase/30S ribosomal protein S1 [Ruminococcaceae bacterium OttesenSCG-928-D13]